MYFVLNIVNIVIFFVVRGVFFATVRRKNPPLKIIVSPLTEFELFVSFFLFSIILHERLEPLWRVHFSLFLVILFKMSEVLMILGTLLLLDFALVVVYQLFSEPLWLLP